MKRILKDKICPYCKKLFRPMTSIQKYCNQLCYMKDGTSRRKGITSKCPICKKEIYSHKSKKRVYCSRQCSFKSKIKGKPLICKICKKRYTRTPSHIRSLKNNFCSKKCFGKWQSKTQKGKNSILYIDGRTPKNRRLRRALTYLKRTQGFYTDYVVSQKPEFTDLTSAVVSRARRWWDQRRVPLLP